MLWLHRIEGALARPPQHSEKNFSRDGLGTKWGTETPQRRGFKPKLPTPQMLEGRWRLLCRNGVGWLCCCDSAPRTAWRKQVVSERLGTDWVPRGGSRPYPLCADCSTSASGTATMGTPKLVL